MRTKLTATKQIYQILQLKNKTEKLKELIYFKGQPCLFTVHFHFLGCKDKEFLIWLEPNWNYSDLLEKLKDILRGREHYIINSGILNIKTLFEKE